jgi:hypothetical protein
MVASVIQFWRTHKPEDCKPNALKAKREQRKKSKDEKKGKTLQASVTIIDEPPEDSKKEEMEPLEDSKKEEEEPPHSDTWRDNAGMYQYDSKRSLSSEDFATMAADPYLFWYQQARQREWRKTRRQKERRRSWGSNKATKRAKEAEKRVDRQKKLLVLVQEAKIDSNHNPEAKKARIGHK